MARFDPRGKVNRALLVGVPDYDFKQPEHPVGVSGDLKAVEHNLAGLERSLQEGGVFAEDEITVTRPRTVDQFDRQLENAVDAAQGLLLLYFSGHGAVPSTGDELWLLMRRAKIVPGTESVFLGAAPWKSVLTVLSGARAEQVVVILDCCYAGNASGAWDALGAAQRQRISLLMCVQANNRIDAGDADTPTPFTAQLVRLLSDGLRGQGGEVGFDDLADQLRGYMSAHHTTLREPSEPWEPQSRSATSGADVLLAAPPVLASGKLPPPVPGPEGGGGTPQSPGPPAGLRPPEGRVPGRRPGGLGRRSGLGPLTGRKLAAAIGVPAAIAGLVATGLALLDDKPACKPPLELRLLTDPDLEPTVRRAAEAYLMSDENRTDDGCRRSGITVYSAGAAAAVAAFNRQSDPWQRPTGDDNNPQRDIGPQPDIWIPASIPSVDRARPASTERTYAALEADPEPFAYSPVVLAVPQNIAAEAVAERVGGLAALTEALRKREPRAEIRRTDPENTDSGLLATVGLYGAGAPDPAAAERGVAQAGPPSRTGGDLLCTLPDDEAVDERTTALVPEFLLKAGVGCDSATRARRMAEYPVDVPGLTPTFVRVRWLGADLDKDARDDAVERFRAWLTGKEAAGKKGAASSAPEARGGLAVFGKDGFRSAAAGHRPLGNGTGPSAGTDVAFAEFGALENPGPLTGAALPSAMTAALKGYREANGPGRVLFLLDSSGSMGGLWEGPGGAPGIIAQSLAGLGEHDEYGVWAVAAEPGSPRAYSEVLQFGNHRREEAQRTIAANARVKDLEADPYKALVAALEEMGRRRTDDHRPQLIVYITDDEDNNRLTEAGRLSDLLLSAREKKTPVVMASLDSGGCDKGKPDAAVSEASGGRCLDTKSDLVARLRDEVARTGTGDEG
ncbi:vWA domain-containing protein [Streptomyces sp. ISL-94]|uniref:vWA domain-containing protein n=1 Tax=Streptomyces sp. ISL-94 TaxID=2819190 RepID=UPI001BE74602|nr:vWA domain-containing protein [Streptomyces sp. ISL-94]MBT2480809.1 VWA domain-containing protein [Streptomyces sp. ISL-94]